MMAQMMALVMVSRKVEMMDSPKAEKMAGMMAGLMAGEMVLKLSLAGPMAGKS